jgi:hypothetical protein
MRWMPLLIVVAISLYVGKKFGGSIPLLASL